MNSTFPTLYRRSAARGYYVSGKSPASSAPPLQTGHAVFPHPAFLFSSHQCYREDSRHSQSDQSQVVIDESIPCHPIRWTNGALAPTFQMLDQPLTQKRVQPLKPHPVMETTKIGAPSFHLPVDPGHQLRYRHIRRLGIVTDRPNGAGDDRVNGARRTW